MITICRSGSFLASIYLSVGRFQLDIRLELRRMAAHSQEVQDTHEA